MTVLARLRDREVRETFAFDVFGDAHVAGRNAFDNETTMNARYVVVEFVNGKIEMATAFGQEWDEVTRTPYSVDRRYRIRVHQLDPLPPWLEPLLDITFCRAMVAMPAGHVSHLGVESADDDPRVVGLSTAAVSSDTTTDNAVVRTNQQD
jgi:hypothetical protein